VHEPGAAGHSVSGIARTRPALGATLGLSLGTLAGLPPSPLFVSELLIVAGGFTAGLPWVAGAAALMLALAFLGMMRALLETTVGEAPQRSGVRLPGLRGVSALAAVTTLALLGLAGASPWLPATELVHALAKGVS
jgi:formate hydrogenlyase subunit 3/multisubunit Na+/H+ antiporter MnhD subunit